MAFCHSEGFSRPEGFLACLLSAPGDVPACLASTSWGLVEAKFKLRQEQQRSDAMRALIGVCARFYLGRSMAVYRPATTKHGKP